MRSVRAASLAAVLLLALALAGCAAPGGSEQRTSSAAASAAPSATPLPSAPNRPASRIALTCDSALPLLAKLTPEGLSVVADRVTDDEIADDAQGGAWRLGPLSVLAAADQGVHCDYAAGTQRIVLDAVPDDDGSIAASFQGGTDCGGTPCEPIRFGHGVALQVQYDDGATTQDTQQQVLSDLLSAATIRGDVAKTVQAADPNACTSALPVAAAMRIDSAVTAAKARGVGDAGDAWSIDAALAFAAHVGGMCDYLGAGGSTVFSLSWLPDGAWAYDTYAQGDDLKADGTDAKFTCDAVACTVDVLAHDTWYRISGSADLDESTLRAYVNDLAA